jgi:hypothetical protein
MLGKEYEIVWNKGNIMNTSTSPIVTIPRQPINNNGGTGMARISFLTNSLIYRRWNYVWLPYVIIGYIAGYLTNSDINLIVCVPITVVGGVLIFYISRRHERFIANLHWL